MDDEPPIENETKARDLDDVLEEIGQFGRYQKLVIFLIILPAILPSGFHSYSQVFIAAGPDDYWCRVPELANLSHDAKRAFLPKNPDGSSSYCTEYAFINYTALLYDNASLDVALANQTTVACRNGWEYDIKAVTRSVVTDWNLVCDREFYPTLALILLSAGEFVFAPVFGYVSDHYGRKLPYFICLVLQLIFGIATAFAPNFTVFCVFRFIVGGTYGPMNLLMFVLGIEIVGPKYRSSFAVLAAVAYALGCVMLGGVAWLVTDWFPFTLWSSAPFALFILYWFIMPESPRWLISQGRHEEVVGMLRTIAEWNRKPQSDEYFQQVMKELQENAETEKYKESHKEHSYLDLFRTPRIRRNVLLMALMNVVNLSVYTGLSYFGPSLSDENPHLSFFLLSIVEMPANFVVYILAERVGRRGPLIVGLILSGVLLIAAVAVPEDQYWPYLILCLLAKLCVTVAYAFSELVEGELFPTVIRSEGCAFTELVSSASSTAVPVIVYAGYQHLALPLMIFGGLSVVAGVAGLWIPETRNTVLPETIADGEALGAHYKWKDRLNICQIERAPMEPVVLLKVKEMLQQSDN